MSKHLSDVKVVNFSKQHSLSDNIAFKARRFFRSAKKHKADSYIAEDEREKTYHRVTAAERFLTAKILKSICEAIKNSEVKQ